MIWCWEIWQEDRQFSCMYYQQATQEFYLKLQAMFRMLYQSNSMGLVSKTQRLLWTCKQKHSLLRLMKKVHQS